MHDSHAESTGKVGTTEGLQRLGITKSKNCASQNSKNHQNHGCVAEVGLAHLRVRSSRTPYSTSTASVLVTQWTMQIGSRWGRQSTTKQEGARPGFCCGIPGRASSPTTQVRGRYRPSANGRASTAPLDNPLRPGASTEWRDRASTEWRGPTAGKIRRSERGEVRRSRTGPLARRMPHRFGVPSSAWRWRFA